jgi:hypothetical protein
MNVEKKRGNITDFSLICSTLLTDKQQVMFAHFTLSFENRATVFEENRRNFFLYYFGFGPFIIFLFSTFLIRFKMT